MGIERRLSAGDATTYLFEQKADVAWNDATGQYLVVWQEGDYDYDNRSDAIFSRLVGPDGRALGGKQRVGGTAAATEVDCPAVAWGATQQEYLVVWEDHRNASADIWGRRVGPDGKALAPAFRISRSVQDELCPDVAWSSTANEFLVVWEDHRKFSTRGTDIYGRRVGPAGAVMGTSDFPISDPGATADDSSPAVAWGATAGQYLVVWEDSRDYANDFNMEIYGRRVKADGTRVGSGILICDLGAKYFDRDPAVAWAPTNNQFLVVWESRRDSPTNIYGQRVRATGSLAETNILISDSGDDTDNSPALVWSGTTKQFLVVWQDWRNNNASPDRGADVYGRLVQDNGLRLEPGFRVSGENAVNGEYAPAVAWDALKEKYLVVWDDRRDDPSRGPDIYGRTVSG